MNFEEFVEKYNNEHKDLEFSDKFTGPRLIDKANGIAHPWELVDCLENIKIAYEAGYQKAKEEYIDSDTFDKEFK